MPTHDHNYLILDIETLSTRDDAAIFAICCINQDGDGLCQLLDLEEQKDAHRDDDTLLWLIGQDMSWLKTMGPKETNNRAGLHEDLNKLYMETGPEHVWVRGPDFDLPKLRHYFENITWPDWPLSPHYKTRDVRTAEDLVGAEPCKQKHNPYEDCMAAKAIIDRYYIACDEAGAR
jgi:hypothetical protein